MYAQFAQSVQGKSFLSQLSHSVNMVISHPKDPLLDQSTHRRIEAKRSQFPHIRRLHTMYALVQQLVSGLVGQRFSLLLFAYFRAIEDNFRVERNIWVLHPISHQN